MAEETIITWNATNWVTIVLMVALGYFIISTVIGFVKRRNGGGNDNE